MSSANPTRINEFMSSCYACNCCSSHRCKKPLLFVFSKHSKNVYPPSWRDSVAVSSLFLFLLFPFLAIGSAKVRRSFEMASKRRKFLFFLVSLGSFHFVSSEEEACETLTILFVSVIQRTCDASIWNISVGWWISPELLTFILFGSAKVVVFFGLSNFTAKKNYLLLFRFSSPTASNWSGLQR